MPGASPFVGASHYFGGDLTVSASGDLLAASGIPLANQRLLRRLMTNPGAVLYHPEYGAGLGRFVGQPADTLQIRAIIFAQMLLEASVDQTVTPAVAVQVSDAGYVFVAVSFTYAPTGETSSLNFKVTN